MAEPREPSDVTTSSVEEALRIPEDALKGINAYAREHRIRFLSDLLDLDYMELEKAADGAGVSVHEFRDAMHALVMVLAQTTMDAKSPAEYAQDLERRGVSREVISKLPSLVEGIEVTEEELRDVMRSVALSASAVPRLTDFDVVFDIRAVFKHLPSASVSADHKKAVATTSEWVPVAVMSFEVRDEAGHESAFTVQFRAREFRHFVRVLEDSVCQLDVVESRVKTIPIGG